MVFLYAKKWNFSHSTLAVTTLMKPYFLQDHFLFFIIRKFMIHIFGNHPKFVMRTLAFYHI